MATKAKRKKMKMVHQVRLFNASLAESAVNTYTNTIKEITGTSSAKAVFIRSSQIDVVKPDLEDAINWTYGRVLAGNHENRTSRASLGTAGVFGLVDEMLNSDATDVIAESNKSPTDCVAYVPVPRDADGKFYITLEVEGSGNAAAKGIYLSGTIDIIS